MLNDFAIFEQAIHKLSSWGVANVDIWFCGDFEEGDRWATVNFTKGACEDKEARDQAYSIRETMERAARSILDLQGIRIDRLENPYLDLSLDLRAEIFTYRGYEDHEEQKVLQRRRLTWPLGENAFVDAIQFESPSMGKNQAAIFEAWRPHPASKLEIEWSKPGKAYVTANGGTILYGAIWPECVPLEAGLLTKAIEAYLPVPASIHSRSTWQSTLVLDFPQGDLSLVQTEVLDLQHEFCCGAMPAREMFWLSASSQDDRLSPSDREHWLSTGSIAASNVDPDMLEELVGIQNIEQSATTDLSEEIEDSGRGSDYVYEDYGEDDSRLLNAEFLDDQDSFARAHEDGWFYGD